ncbi:hypothetical protein B0H16DRAFT_1481598 [Mycena metata]|uniref:Uncharacterized protein n=1 Tax=Mycena metata TaxID=1033252 RepID=A0AAD7GX55_9AGAR|nr:hypothetical protein B0H16DRAFT_1481598 [Mycena metata]
MAEDQSHQVETVCESRNQGQRSLACLMSTVGAGGLAAGEWLVKFHLEGSFWLGPEIQHDQGLVTPGRNSYLILAVGPRGPAAGQSLGKPHLGGNFWLRPEIQPDRGSVACTRSKLGMVGQSSPGGQFLARTQRSSMTEDQPHPVKTMSCLISTTGPGGMVACLTSTFGAGGPAAACRGMVGQFSPGEDWSPAPGPNCVEGFTFCLRVVSMPHLNRWGRGICCRAMVGQISPGGQFFGWDPRSSLSDDWSVAPGQNCVEGLKSCLKIISIPYFNQCLRVLAMAYLHRWARGAPAEEWLANFGL